MFAEQGLSVLSIEARLHKDVAITVFDDGIQSDGTVTFYGPSRFLTQDVIEMVLEMIKKSLESGEDVLVSGFGKFCVREKRERRGRNPATGQDITLAPRRVVTFRCSGKLRDKING